jgi:hypothetical protein
MFKGSKNNKQPKRAKGGDGSALMQQVNMIHIVNIFLF